jgi:VanZ family protein
LHFIAFFLLTLTFYWILETSRRKVIHYTLIVITLGLGVASEVVQGLLPVSMLVSPGGDRPTLIGLG